MKLKNISNGKIIGIGDVTVLPGETKDIPKAYENSPVLEVYKRSGFAEIIGKAAPAVKSKSEAASKKAAEKKKAAEEEKLRQARLASLDGISEEDLGKLANELGINPAECKDQSDVLEKVKAALSR